MIETKRSNYSITETISPQIFRAYDIRGIVDENLTPDVVYTIGLAIGSEALKRGQKKLVIARDGRLSGPVLLAALTEGLLDSGCDLIDIGMVPTPVLYFATFYLQTNSGLMLTGSHNPANYNGIKTVLNSNTLAETDIQDLYQRILQRNFSSGRGVLEKQDISQAYIERITKDIHIERPLKIVIDSGNGVTGNIAPTLYRRLGCQVVELFCEIDGHFPNHHPDPGEEKNLKDLRTAVLAHQADLGLAFDGDGDRLGVITDKGHIIWPDRQMMLFARDVLSRLPGSTIVFDVKCSRHLPEVIQAAGGQPLMWKTGHSLLKAKMKEESSPLAGEMSGHIFFKERWYGFDDGTYAGARLLEIISRESSKVSDIFNQLPDSINTPELKVPLPEERKTAFMKQLLATASFENAKITTIDGLRVDFSDGWGLARVSNTSPNLILRFEAKDETSLVRIKELFRDKLLAVDKELALPF